MCVKRPLDNCVCVCVCVCVERPLDNCVCVERPLDNCVWKGHWIIVCGKAIG